MSSPGDYYCPYCAFPCGDCRSPEQRRWDELHQRREELRDTCGSLCGCGEEQCELEVQQAREREMDPEDLYGAPPRSA